MFDPAATVQLTCPDEQTLGRFLNDQLAPEEDSRVAGHVDCCPACQLLLERLPGSLPREVEYILAIPSADDPAPRLDGYEVLGLLGRGGMGVVWRVRDLKFGREVALKVMQTRLCGMQELERRFLN